MNEEYKGAIVLTTIIVIGLLLFVAMILYRGYSEKKLETEQPKYFIELKGNLYELKEVD